jgi:hypothetical protein
MIDIENLADDCGLKEVNYIQLKQFAEAYHKAKCEQAEPVAETAGNSVKWLHKRLSNLPCGIKLYKAPPDQTAEIERLKVRERKLVEVVKVVLHISDRTHEAWDVTKEIIKEIEAENE